MGFFYSLYNEVLYRPIFNGLIWFYNNLPGSDFGLAIILLTIVIRLLLTPLLWRGQAAQRKLALLQPEIKRVQEQFKNDREKQGKALMELYAQHSVNPFSGCLVLIVQLPVLIALFHVFRRGFDPAELALLYRFVENPGVLNPLSFGIIDLSKGNLYLGAIAALTQYFQIKLTTPPQKISAGKADFSQILQWQSLYIFPALVLVWSYTLPAALTLYWTVLNLFGIVQEIVVRKRAKTV